MQLELLEELTILFQTHPLDKIDWHRHIRIHSFFDGSESFVNYILLMHNLLFHVANHGHAWTLLSPQWSLQQLPYSN